MRKRACLQLLEKWKRSDLGWWFDSRFWSGIRPAKSNSGWMLCTMTLLLRCRLSKIGLMSFTSFSDEPCRGVLKTATTGDNATKIHNLELAYRWLIAKTVVIWKVYVGHILLEILVMRKLWWCCIYSLQTTGATLRPLQSSVWLCRPRNPKKFLHRFVTINKTWISLVSTIDQGTVETVGFIHGRTCSIEGKVLSLGKVATVFWDSSVAPNL